eukprot:RCo023498
MQKYSGRGNERTCPHFEEAGTSSMCHVCSSVERCNGFLTCTSAPPDFCCGFTFGAVELGCSPESKRASAHTTPVFFFHFSFSSSSSSSFIFCSSVVSSPFCACVKMCFVVRALRFGMCTAMLENTSPGRRSSFRVALRFKK